MINRNIAKAAVWECRRCGAVSPGGSLAVADSPTSEIARAELGKLPTVNDAPAPSSLDPRLLRCAVCGAREIEIPIELFDIKRLR